MLNLPTGFLADGDTTFFLCLSAAEKGLLRLAIGGGEFNFFKSLTECCMRETHGKIKIYNTSIVRSYEDCQKYIIYYTGLLYNT